MTLLKKQCSKSAGLGPSSSTPIAQAFNKLGYDEREKLRVKFDKAYFVATETFKVSYLKLSIVLHNFVTKAIYDLGFKSIRRFKPSLYIIHLMYNGCFRIVRWNNHKIRVGGLPLSCSYILQHWQNSGVYRLLSVFLNCSYNLQQWQQLDPLRS